MYTCISVFWRQITGDEVLEGCEFALDPVDNLSRVLGSHVLGQLKQLEHFVVVDGAGVQLCVCVCVCVCVCACVCVCGRVCVDVLCRRTSPLMHTSIRECTHTRTHTHTIMHVLTHTHTHSIHTYIHRYIHTQLRTYTLVCTHTCIHTYMQTHIRTYKHMCILIDTHVHKSKQSHVTNERMHACTYL